jgi:TatD DNase family protein
MYINIHTHSLLAGHLSIVSLYEKFEQSKQPGFYSIGLHPLYLDRALFEDVKQWAVYERILAIGECGLDKLSSFPLELQQQEFYKQVLLANELNKPLIIHCVRAFDEVVAVLKHARVPVIFHGFNKSRELAKQLIDKGYYLSLGKVLEQERSKELVSVIPVTQLFLETDNNDIRIETIYQLAADAYNVELNSLSLQLQKNAITVFGEKIVHS